MNGPENKLKKEDSEFSLEEGSERNLEMESYEGKECSVCKDVPESIIYLSCEHIICLVCAAKAILYNESQEEIDISQIICLICGESTGLSQEVQKTLCEFITEENLQLNNAGEASENSEEEETDKRGSKKEQSPNPENGTLKEKSQALHKLDTE